MAAAGALGVIKMPGPLKEAGHLMGTTRMGTDPSSSVVDPFCRTHDVANLYVLDGSPFVTGAAVNPTATIMANAARCIEAIIARRREQKSAA
jgi:choline dehydrogenase-like flavoprotein